MKIEITARKFYQMSKYFTALLLGFAFSLFAGGGRNGSDSVLGDLSELVTTPTSVVNADYSPDGFDSGSGSADSADSADSGGGAGADGGSCSGSSV